MSTQDPHAQAYALAKRFDNTLARIQAELSSAISILDREIELSDRNLKELEANMQKPLDT